MQAHNNNTPAANREDGLTLAVVELLTNVLHSSPHASQSLIASVERMLPMQRSLECRRKLTKRQDAALQLLLEGKEQEEICLMMWITPSTYRDFTSAIRKAYDVSETKDALIIARIERAMVREE